MVRRTQLGAKAAALRRMAKITLPLVYYSETVARWLGVPNGRLQRWARQGLIPSRRLPSGEYVFPADDLAVWLRTLPNDVAGSVEPLCEVAHG